MVATLYCTCRVQEIVIKMAFQATTKRCLIKKHFKKKFLQIMVKIFGK